MPRGTLDRIKMAIRNEAFDMTVHASEEMAEDQLDILDVMGLNMRDGLRLTGRLRPNKPLNTDAPERRAG